MNLPKLIAVLALGADAITWFAYDRPGFALCWLLAAVATAIWIPAR